MSRSDNFKKIIDSISSKVDGDNASDIKAELRQVSVLFEDTISSLSGFGAENKEKRLAIQNLEKENRELRAEVDDTNAKFEDLRAKDNTEEFNALKEFKQNVLAQNKAKFIKQFEEITEHDKFSKVKEYFNMPNRTDDGYDFDSMSDEQMEHNVAELDKLTKIDYFDNTPSEPSEPKNQAYGIKAPLPADFNSQLDSVTTMEELEKLNTNIN